MKLTGQLALIAACSVLSGFVAVSAQSPALLTVTGQTIDAVPGLPVEAAEVFLNSVASDVKLKTVSGRDGRFVFDRVTPAGYYVFASKPGFFMAAYNDDFMRGGSDVLIVAWPGPPQVTLKMWAHASITGTVSDESGRRIAGAKVTALKQSQAWASWGRRLIWMPALDIKTAVTDDRGQYALQEVDAGQFVIRVDATAVPLSGSRPTAFRLEYSPGTDSIDRADRVAVAPGQHVVADVRLDSTPVFEVSGLIDTAAHDVGTVHVELVPMAEADRGQGANVSASVQAAQSFVFARVPAGDYLIEASASNGFWGEQRVSVDDHAVSDLDLRLLPPVTISGRVVWEGTDEPPGKATVQRDFSMNFDCCRPSDEEIAKMKAAMPVSLVSLLPVDSIQSMMGGSSGLRWAPDSTFSITLRPGRYFAQDAGLKSWFLKSLRIGGHEAVDEPVDIQAGTNDAVLTLTRSMGEVRGTIVDSTGRPDTSSMVLLFSTNPRFWPGVYLRTPHVLEEGTDSGGHFILSDVLPGEYYLAAAPILPWDRLDDDVFRALIPSAVRIQVVPGVPVTRTLTRAR